MYNKEVANMRGVKRNAIILLLPDSRLQLLKALASMYQAMDGKWDGEKWGKSLC